MDHRSPPGHPVLDPGSRQGMTGEGRDLAADAYLVARKIQGFIPVEGQLEGRKDELVDPETGAAETPAGAVDPEGEKTVPLSDGKGELSGSRAEVIGFQLYPGHFLSFGIFQDGSQFQIGDDCEPVDKVSFADDGLELQGIARIVGSAVPVDSAEGSVRGFVKFITVPIAADIDPLALLLQPVLIRDPDGKGIGDPGILPDPVLQGLRNPGKPVEADGLGVHLGIPFPEDQFSGLHGPAAQVLGGIGGDPLRFIPQRQGKPVPVIHAGGRLFRRNNLGGIASIRQDRNRNIQRIKHIETLFRVVQGLFENDLLLVRPDGKLRGREIPEEDAEMVPDHLDMEHLGFEGFDDPLDAGPAPGDRRLRPGKGLPLLLEGAAPVVELLVFLFRGRFLPQLLEIRLHQDFPGIKGHRGPLESLCEPLHRRFPLFGGEALRDGEVQELFIRIASLHLFEKGGIDFILFRSLGRILALPEAVPEDIFPVIGDEPGQVPAHIGAQSPVEGAVLPLESPGMGPDIFPAFVRRGAAELFHPGIGHDRLPEGLDLAAEFPVQAVPELPVPAHRNVDILLAGVVEVDRQVRPDRLFLDQGEDGKHFLGPVRVGRLPEFGPSGGQHVTVVIGFVHIRIQEP